MTATSAAPPWADWLSSWERQQTAYLPDREGRFDVMLDAIEAAAGTEPLVVDLACGPGSISARVLDRFPQARVIAVDLDPVLLSLGRGALGDGGGRLRWVEADLRSDEWIAALGHGQVDAVLSTTALHWLTGPELTRLYRALSQLVRPGGLVLNGDHLAFGQDAPTLQAVAERVKETRRASAFADEGVEDWDAWWERMRQEARPHLPFTERDRRFGGRHRVDPKPDVAFHHAALVEAGFTEVGVLWQNMDNRVLAAVR